MLVIKHKHMPLLNILKYLKLQPLEPTDDGSLSPLDEYEEDETLDLDQDVDGTLLTEEWDSVIEELKEDPDKINFSKE
jgi:hypothetical protein